ncbi:MAG: nucleoside deaminase [Clostridia bacterium]
MEEKTFFMKKALKEAEKAYYKGEVPVGAVIVKDGKIISRGHNLKEIKKDTTKHAEIIAIEKASKKIDAWRLEDCDIYVTMEPCPMCMGAIINSRIRKIYYGIPDLKAGACGSVTDLTTYKFNHIPTYEKNVLGEESKELLQRFFRELRANKKDRGVINEN